MFSASTVTLDTLTIHLQFGWLWWAFACLFVAVFVLGFMTQIRGVWFRGFTAILCLILLADPSIVHENRKVLPSKILVVNDKSSSMQQDKRRAQQTQVNTDLSTAIANKSATQIETLSVSGAVSNGKTTIQRETLAFSALNDNLSNVADNALSAIVMVTDGQIHDVPPDLNGLDENIPVHFLLTGQKSDIDRQVIINTVNTYGLVGDTVPLNFTIKDKGKSAPKSQIVTVRISTPDGQTITLNNIPTGGDVSVDIPVIHTGQNVVQVEVDNLENEITTLNNKVALTINGVRGSLKVLLVSGNANIGERTWRNFLKSDPAVDLVHFTILRQPDRIDPVPPEEMSLIVFPFQELFQEKIEDFDLIIFDHYSLQSILPTFYLANIKTYVENGGALLIASGKTFSESGSIYNSPLRDILPTRPNGAPLNRFYKPQLTRLGKTHPVTQDMMSYIDKNGEPTWGSWGRQIPVQNISGDILMSGIDDNPLLTLSRAGKGRIGHITSDQIWLWSRGFQGGGPHSALLKRLVHWLMKEPSLDENALDIAVRDNQVIVRQRTQESSLSSTLSLELPDGTLQTLKLEISEDGLWRTTSFETLLPGVYTIDDGIEKRPLVIGDINPPELLDMLAGTDKIAPFLKNRRGSVHWLEDMQKPLFRERRDGQSISGKSWIGLRQTQNYSVSDITTVSLVPERLSLLIIGLVLFINWWREGRLRPILKTRKWF